MFSYFISPAQIIVIPLTSVIQPIRCLTIHTPIITIIIIFIIITIIIVTLLLLLFPLLQSLKIIFKNFSVF